MDSYAQKESTHFKPPKLVSLRTQQRTNNRQYILLSFCSSFLHRLGGRKSGQSGEIEEAYQSVPSTSNTTPFSGGALWGFPFTGSKGANRFGGPRVALVVIFRFKLLRMTAESCWMAMIDDADHEFN